MFALSLNYKTADVKLRESFAFDENKAERFLAVLQESGIRECVYLSTCNRCEVYGVGDAYTVLKRFSDFADASEEKVKNHILIFDGQQAVTHLFRVCCGLESMALGEDEILGQVKKAFAFSQERHATGYVCNTVFKAAITSAKKIKTQTPVSKSSVSVATLAAAECRKFSDQPKTVLVIGGSGEIGGKVVKDLLSFPGFQIYATARNGHLSNDALHSIPYAQRYAYADAADILISATKSPHFTLTLDMLKQHIQTQKPRLFIDLAVPRDIDEAVRHLPGAELLQIDDFKKTAQRNSVIKTSALQAAADLMNEDIDVLLKELAFHSMLPEVQKIQHEAVRRFVYRFRDTATAEELKSFLGVFSKMEDAI